MLFKETFDVQNQHLGMILHEEEQSNKESSYLLGE